MLVPKHNVETTQRGLLNLLSALRHERNFDPSVCLDRKAELLNSYFAEHRLSAAVVGLSGGIDSAVVLGLLKKASQAPGSPIKKIIAASLPVTTEQGASNQKEALQKARVIARSFDVEFISPDLGETFNVLKRDIAAQTGISANAWADGQLVSYLRTPALYYLSALLSSTGYPAIVCGTTNRDEGSYLGFFGKASDGMVDLQVISDLHKSEVYALAQKLKVPESTIYAEPSGDVFDGKTHLEMIGAPYDFVELYSNWLCCNEHKKSLLINSLDKESAQQFRLWSERIEEMHRYNLHKYLSGNPSVHLDIYSRSVPGGWKNEGTYKPSEPLRKLVGEFRLDSLNLLNFHSGPRISPKSTEIHGLGGEARVIDNLLSAEECRILTDEVRRQKRLPVGINGVLKDYKSGEDPIGSYRATAYSPELAQIIWQRLQPFLKKEKIMDQYATSDWCQHEKWEPIGVNPAFRYIWYEKGGELIVHYDAGYNPGDNQTHSLMSMVIYLNDCDAKYGGTTRFIRDSQLHLPYAERDFSDWSREADQEEVLLTIQPRRGKSLIFDHRLLHDAEPWSGPEPRIIIRTDIMFRKIQDQSGK